MLVLKTILYISLIIYTSAYTQQYCSTEDTITTVKAWQNAKVSKLYYDEAGGIRQIYYFQIDFSDEYPLPHNSYGKCFIWKTYFKNNSKHYVDVYDQAPELGYIISWDYDQNTMNYVFYAGKGRDDVPYTGLCQNYSGCFTCDFTANCRFHSQVIIQGQPILQLKSYMKTDLDWNDDNTILIFDDPDTSSYSVTRYEDAVTDLLWQDETENGIKVSTKYLSSKPTTTNAQTFYTELRNSLQDADQPSGYCTTYSKLAKNQSLCSKGAKSNIGQIITINFNIKDGSMDSVWDFKFLVDLDAYVVVIDDVFDETYYSTTGLRGYINVSETFSAGQHSIQIFGQEGCCDGDISAQFQIGTVTSYWEINKANLQYATELLSKK